MIITAGAALARDTEWRGGGVALRYHGGDGNVVLWGRGGHVFWAAGCSHPRPDALEFQADGNLVAYGHDDDGNRVPYWASNTFAPDGFLDLSPQAFTIGVSREVTLWSAEPFERDENEPPRPSTPLWPLRVEQNRRYVRSDAGRFEWREASGFSLLGRVLRGEAESHVRPFLRYWKSRGQTVIRNILTLDGDYWREFRSAPDMPNYFEGLIQLAEMHQQEGLYMRACYLGALEPFGGVWDAATRRDIYQGSVRQRAEEFVLEAARQLARFPHIIGELANERSQIGMRDSRAALVRLGERVKAIAPGQLLCASEGIEGEFLVEPFDYADAHFERDLGIGGFQWVKRVSEYLVWQQHLDRFPPGHELAGQPVKRMPIVMGEPPNWGEDRRDGRRGDVEKRPSACFGAAAMLRSRKGAGICFHYDGGLWTTLPTPETEDHVRAFHAALDAFPQMEANLWRGQWGLAAGDYWRDTWPATDDPRDVEAHIRAGRGAYRAFGHGDYSVTLAEPKGWDYRQHLDAPAERVAFCDQGEYPSGVYRRTA